jgi:hypothetical protein
MIEPVDGGGRPHHTRAEPTPNRREHDTPNQYISRRFGKGQGHIVRR